MKGLSLFESSKEIFSKTGVIDSQTLLLMKKREDISKCNHVSLLFCEILLSSCCVQRMRHYYGREITIKSTRKTKKSTLIYGCQDSFRIFFCPSFSHDIESIISLAQEVRKPFMLHEESSLLTRQDDGQKGRRKINNNYNCS